MESPPQQQPQQLSISHLLSTPSDLVCPITLQIFREPVCVSSGHVYERRAILSVLAEARRRNTLALDPLTREKLVTDVLTPVHMLRSRSVEYRESAARGCVEAACSITSAEAAAPFVRRACDLAGDDLKVPGLSAECVAYVLSHPSNAFNCQVLQAFAGSLFASGYRDKAARCYTSLLQAAGVDRSQQAELFKLCLSCWTGGGNAGSVPDTATLEKLAAFANVQGWRHVLDIVQEAGLGAPFTLRLCEFLLWGPAAGSSGASEGEWEREKHVLLRYVQTLCASVKQQSAELQQRLQVLEVAVGLQEREEQGPASDKPALRRRWWRGPKALVSAALAVLALTSPAPVLVQGVRLAPVLALLLVPPQRLQQ